MKKSVLALICVSLLVSCAREEKDWKELTNKPEFDEDWVPLLQTPPFPEYPSGHSVISCSAEVVLRALFGDTFNFVDSTELEFGLPVRAFTSFRHAADEASVSRLYGGIHYRPAIEEGMKQGFAVGNLIQLKVITRIPSDPILVNRSEERETPLVD